MIYIILNLIPILAATVTGLVIGALWLRAGGVAMRPGAPTILTAFIAEFWLTAILAGALILAPPKGGVWTMTLGSAFVIWIGFVLPVLAATYAARGLSARATAADAAHWLAVMLAQATVLRLIGLVAPPG